MDFVEQLKSSIDIVKVVGEYVRLKKSGAGRGGSDCAPSTPKRRHPSRSTSRTSFTSALAAARAATSLSS
jgi:hypothetical protein